VSAEISLNYKFTTTAAPVQAEGAVDGRPFYFRARHSQWTFTIALIDGVDPADLDANDVTTGRAWHQAGEVPGRFAASYLELAEVDLTQFDGHRV
jgi:hypothetical protein